MTPCLTPLWPQSHLAWQPLTFTMFIIPSTLEPARKVHRRKGFLDDRSIFAFPIKLRYTRL